MSIFTKRNALVGFVTLKALERRRKGRRRSSMKLVAFIVLGLISVGVLAGLAAVVIRRQRDNHEETQHLEGYAVADELVEEAESRDVTELDAETSESGSAA